MRSKFVVKTLLTNNRTTYAGITGYFGCWQLTKTNSIIDVNMFVTRFRDCVAYNVCITRHVVQLGYGLWKEWEFTLLNLIYQLFYVVKVVCNYFCICCCVLYVFFIIYLLFSVVVDVRLETLSTFGALHMSAAIFVSWILKLNSFTHW